MCGICGVITLRGDLDLRPLVERIVESQMTRGPDAQAIEVRDCGSTRVLLGHNRLSIIDLRAEANQPMTSCDGRQHIVFNGEIYNFIELRAELERLGAVFRTRSDTEVILAAYRAWGTSAFEHFIGMFALAIHDMELGELLLVRDRFGVKPLYWWNDAKTLVFASTPTVIASWAGLAPNLAYVARGIRYKYYEDDGDVTPYVGLHALRASHLMRVRVEQQRLEIDIRRYYDLSERAAALRELIARDTRPMLEERVRELLGSSCELRCRSDVPLGASVSGGIDSSAVAATLTGAGRRLVGYSFSHPDDASSEGPLVAQLAKATGMEPRWVGVHGADDVRRLFWDTLHAQDAPFPHASIMAQFAVFRAARADGTIVLLGGQGGDEAFMGYRKFVLFYAQSIVRGRRLREVPHFISTVAPLAPAVAKRARMFASERKRYAGASDGMGTRLRLPAANAGESMGLSRGHSIEERQALDVMRYSLPTLLRYEDRNSMGNSIESRLPFMDHRLVELGLALPERAKLGEGFGKLILRRVLEGRVPRSILRNRDKRGFDVDQRRWIEQGLGDELRSALMSRRATVRDLLPSDENVATLYDDRRLADDPQAFKEIVSLIWLGDRL